MTLHEYLTEADLTPSQFAERAGITAGAVRRYLAGTRIPDKEKMAKIALATGCKVTANDFFGIAA